MKPLNTALTDEEKWHRAKHGNGRFSRVIDYYLHILLRQ
jgi:hypothetical protein